MRPRFHGVFAAWLMCACAGSVPRGTGDEPVGGGGGKGDGGGTSGAQTVFGTLVSLPEHAAFEAGHGVKMAMLELAWEQYEPGDGQFDATYVAGIRDRIAAFRGADQQITLALGLHNPPAWALALPDARYVDQHGVVSDEINLVFNQQVRAKAAAYLARIDHDLGLASFAAIRLTSGGLAEILYPGDGSYFAFDRNAQNGPELPPSMAPNPFPGWRPQQRSISVAQVRQWAEWYVGALDDVIAWQIETCDALGFTGDYQLLTPGWGARPDEYEDAIANFLPDSIAGVGAVWHRFYALLPDKSRVIAYESAMSDHSGDDDGCDLADADVALTDPVIDTWSATRWLTRIAFENQLDISGENPGFDAPPELNDFYADPSDAGMMATAFRQAATCGLRTFYWAHDERLWDGTVPFSRFAEHIADF